MKQPICNVALVLGALLFGLSVQVEASGQGKNPAGQRGGQAAAHRSNSGSVTNNAQWSADPTRGWVRAEERHQLTNPSAPSKTKAEKVKQRYKAKAKRN